MLDIAMQACQASSEGFRNSLLTRSRCTSKLRRPGISQAFDPDPMAASDMGIVSGV
jgi:hypothetical protein